MRVKLGKRILGVTMSMAMLLSFTGCSNTVSMRVSENLMTGVTGGESGILYVTPSPWEIEKGDAFVEGSYSAVIEPMMIEPIMIQEDSSKEGASKYQLKNADELFTFLSQLNYSSATYDNIPEYSITFHDGTQYYVDVSGGIVTLGASDVKLAEDEVSMLCRMMEAAKESETEADPAAVVTDFGVRLLRNSFSRDESRNTLISPLSVISALAMTANGAGGETLQQMEHVFGFSVPELNTYMSSYLRMLPEAEKYKLHMANAIWFQDTEGFSVEQNFLQTNADIYNAGLYQAPFDHTTVKEINGWVAEHTDGMIKEILKEMEPETVMYLINALSFDAEWQSIYYDHQVRDSVFTKEDGTTSKVKLMYSTESDYLETEQAEGFLKYYADRKYAFAALLPREGVTVSELLTSLTGEELHRILEHPVETTVHGAIPKFESEYSVEMSQILQEMGMVDAFDIDRADFSGIGSHREGNLYISGVVHKTFIEVSERGTRAGAATMVAVNCSAAAPQEIRTVYLDRPFVYMIVDCESNLPVFIGTVMEV